MVRGQRLKTHEIFFKIGDYTFHGTRGRCEGGHTGLSMSENKRVRMKIHSKTSSETRISKTVEWNDGIHARNQGNPGGA